ncbi:MAG: MFS transporter [Proteobacteria bacterium]|nr:MFS transporter [Pseudomonadota bacterium]
MLINFGDKVVVGLAKGPISEELNLSQEEYGLLASSFFFLFAASAVVVGFVANRIRARWVLLVMAVIWSLVQFPMLATVNLEVLMACRIVLGIGEGPAAAVAVHATYKWFPDKLRGLPTAILAQGSALGVIVTVPVLNWIILRYSWHWAFGALGIAGLLWAVAWLIFGREGTLVDRPADGASHDARIPYRYLLTCPSIVAAACTCFSAYWGLSLGLTWFTSYLREALGYSQQEAGTFTILPWIFGFFVVMIGGFISQRLSSNGVSSRIARGIFPAVTLILGGCLMPFVGSLPSPALNLGLLIFGSAIGSTVYVVLPMIVSELTPHPQRAAMLATSGAFYTLAGIIAPFVMGKAIQDAATPAAGYEFGYLIMGCLMIAGGLIGFLFVRPEADRKRLAHWAVPPAGIQPARA